MNLKKNWYSLELPIEEAVMFEEYLRERAIQFEPSSAFTLIHIQCLMTEEECGEVNKWLKTSRVD